ncbi:MAG: alkaline phosphatase family protein [Acidimicrobiales bacterium]
MKTFRVRRWGAVLAGAALVSTMAGVVASASPLRTVHGFKLPAVKHVWVIVLENEDYATTFGDPSADPYLAKTLPSKGVLLEDYYGIGHHSNDNYIAMVSGQPPNPDTQNDCTTFVAFPPGKDAKGIEHGAGCVYPSDIENIGNELSTAHLSWKAYEQDMGNIPSRESAACGHPAVGKPDNTEIAVPGDGYASRHDPFVYFASVIGMKAYCGDHVVALGSATGAMPKGALKGETGLATDLKSVATTPTYSFITPNLCSDGHDFPCKNEKGGASALADIDAWLGVWVPKIMSSAAYKQGGLIEITFDESEGTFSDSTACCDEQPGPDAPLPGINGPGGGKVGAVLISPFIKPGTKTSHPYNHYSLLATDEKLFGLPLLGYAKTAPATFGSDVFTAKA